MLTRRAAQPLLHLPALAMTNPLSPFQNTSGGNITFDYFLGVGHTNVLPHLFEGPFAHLDPEDQLRPRACCVAGSRQAEVRSAVASWPFSASSACCRSSADRHSPLLTSSTSRITSHVGVPELAWPSFGPRFETRPTMVHVLRCIQSPAHGLIKPLLGEREKKQTRTFTTILHRLCPPIIVTSCDYRSFFRH
jgi:hypothetical protein